MVRRSAIRRKIRAIRHKAERPFKVRLPQKEGFGPGADLALFVDPADLVLLTG